MLNEQLSIGRSITLPSTASGGAKMGAIATGAYARIRKQFGLSIGRFEGVEEALARIAGKAYAISALSQATAMRSEEHTSDLQSLMRISYAVFCLKKNKNEITP